jgi:hypothetical protein
MLAGPVTLKKRGIATALLTRFARFESYAQLNSRPPAER